MVIAATDAAGIIFLIFITPSGYPDSFGFSESIDVVGPAPAVYRLSLVSRLPSPVLTGSRFEGLRLTALSAQPSAPLSSSRMQVARRDRGTNQIAKLTPAESPR